MTALAEIARCRTHQVRLLFDTDLLGRIFGICEACERQRPRRCRDCPNPTTGRRVRCAPCRRRRMRAQAIARYAGNPEQHRARRRRWYANLTPVGLAEQKALARAWTMAHPTSRRLARRKAWLLYGTSGVRSRTDYLAAQQRYATKHHAAILARQRARYRQDHPLPPSTLTCIDCGAAFDYCGKGRKATRCPVHRAAFKNRQKMEWIANNRERHNANQRRREQVRRTAVA